MFVNRNSVFSEAVASKTEDEYQDDFEDYDMQPIEEIELAKEFFTDRQKVWKIGN